MKSVDLDLSQERRLLTNMIVDSRFLREIIPVFRLQYLKSSYTRIIAQWVLDYYEKYEKAPYKDIQEVYRSHRSSLRDEENTNMIGDFLHRLSADWEKTKPNNVEFSLHESIQYLKIRSQELLEEDLHAAIKANDTAKGEQAISNYKRVEKPLGEGVSLLHDTAKVTMAFSESEDHLFTLPGALGKVAGKLGRGDFLAFFAPMKRGKTWWLMFVGEIAMSYGLKVVFFTMEMTENQMIRRSWRAMNGSPLNTSVVTIPYFEESDDSTENKPMFTVETKEEKREGIDLTRVDEIQKKLRRRYRTGDIKIISLPSRSASVSDLSVHLDNLAFYDNFIPDVVIVDYADLLRPEEKFRGDYRHGLDDIWAALRRMAQERNVLEVSASQSSKDTFSQDVTETHVAEDIRKLAHVTTALSLNRTKKEEEKGIIRVAQMVVREEGKNFNQAVVLQCLDIGRCCIDSRLRREVVDLEPPAKKYTRKSD